MISDLDQIAFSFDRRDSGCDCAHKYRVRSGKDKNLSHNHRSNPESDQLSDPDPLPHSDDNLGLQDVAFRLFQEVN